MASRMSNRDRIQRMAQEADAVRREKAEKAKTKPKRKAAPRKKAASRKKAGAKGRVKIVWAVCVPAGKAVEIFPYRDKDKAQAAADRLTEKKGTLYVVRSERQPMTEDE